MNLNNNTMNLTEREMYLCYQSLYFEIDQVTDGLKEHVEDYRDEIELMEKIYNRVVKGFFDKNT